MTQPKIDPIRAAHLALGGAADDAGAADELRRALDRRYPQPRPAERIIQALLDGAEQRRDPLMAELVHVITRKSIQADCQELVMSAQGAHIPLKTSLRTASYSAGKLLHIQLIREGEGASGHYRRVMGEGYHAPQGDNPLDGWWAGMIKLAAGLHGAKMRLSLGEDHEEGDLALYDLINRILSPLDLRRVENGVTVRLAQEMHRLVGSRPADAYIYLNPLPSPRWNEPGHDPDEHIRALNRITQDILKDKS